MEIPESVRASLIQGGWILQTQLSTYLHIPSTPNLKVSAVNLQISDLTIHLSALQAGNSPTSLHNDGQGGEIYGPCKRNQTSLVFGCLAHKDTVPQRGPT